MAERILVVDDEPDLLELVRVNLRQAGYEAETEAAGRAALERLSSWAPDMVILDLRVGDRCSPARLTSLADFESKRRPRCPPRSTR